MAADLHIHAVDGLEEEDLACFRSRRPCPDSPACPHWRRVAASPNVWVGEVSWLKAALAGSAAFVPESVQAIRDLIGDDLPVLDAALKDLILTAAATPNTRAPGYETTTEPAELSSWLDEHMGQRIFTVSW